MSKQQEPESADEGVGLLCPVTKQRLLMPCPGGCLMPEAYRQYQDRIRDFSVRPDDVWLCGFLRSGTTWTLELTWLLVNNLDFQRAKEQCMSDRVPLIERVGMLPPNLNQLYGDSVEHADQLSSPRCIRSHLPVPMLPRQLWTVKPKIIYVARNPKDVAVSYYHLIQLYFGAEEFTFEKYCDLFLSNEILYSPYWNGVLQFWNHRNDENVLWNTYEDMKKDLPAAIRRIASFLGRPVSDAQVLELERHLSFQSMRDNPSVNKADAIGAIRRCQGLPPADNSFIRRGEAGAADRVLSPELRRRFDIWMRESTSGTDYQLPGC